MSQSVVPIVALVSFRVALKLSVAYLSAVGTMQARIAPASPPNNGRMLPALGRGGRPDVRLDGGGAAGRAARGRLHTPSRGLKQHICEHSASPKLEGLS